MSVSTRRFSTWALVCGCAFLLSACTCLPKGLADLDVGAKDRGIASWYGDDFHGRVTTSGEIYNMEALTGAHRTLPLGSVVRVTNVVNGKQVRVRINDRGPYVNGRVIDLSYAAARELEMVEHGVSAVSLEVISGHGEEFLVADNLSVRTLVALDTLPESKDPEKFRAVTQRLALWDAHAARGVRMPPGDFMLERRARRVSDILAAERRVYTAAALYIP